MQEHILSKLIDDLARFPGIGKKTSQRMAIHLLNKDRKGAEEISTSIQEALSKVRKCGRCRALTEFDICGICQSEKRSESQICVVENLQDLYAIEQGGSFRGRYFVLYGHLSPIDGISADDLGIDLLIDQLSDGEVQEIIIATNLTVEGQATAYFIAEKARSLDITVSRIAHGVPVGGELEYLDGNTLNLAIETRQGF